MLVGILFILNLFAQVYYTKWDMTEDKRFSFTKPTIKLLESQEDVIFIDVLLEGNFPAGFKRLQEATREMLDGFKRINPNIEYRFQNPNEGTVEEINARRDELAKDGVVPTNLRTREAGEAKEQLIYPYALVRFSNRMIPVNLLESEQPGISPEVVLNNSIALLEYKFANAIAKLKQTRQSNIVFTEGHGELSKEQTAYLETELRRFYATGRVNLDSVIQIPQDIDLVIVPKPVEPFTDRQLFILDQYLVKGGNILFLIDALDVSLDSINYNGTFIPQPYSLNLDQFFFKIGARVNPDLVLDLQCTRIPMVIGNQGDRVQTELFNWFYHPLVAPVSEHPIVNRIDRVNFNFPSSIDTIQTSAPIRKTILLQSSPYSRIQKTPVRLNFEILRYEPDPQEFDQGPQSLALLLEGKFESLFENRMTSDMEALLESVNATFAISGEPGKALIVSDGDLVKSLFDARTGDYGEIGLNKFENFVFKGNQDFIFNAVEYMLDENGVLSARSKELQLRMLNTVKAKAESRKWQLLNICFPLILLLLGGLFFQQYRKRKYTR